ncbi:hypothetical protein GS941_22435 [Rhodococcus hoagii]|nr:hypothetical protein [Prescottella equi]
MDDSDESAITMTQNINKTREALDRQNRAVLDQNKALGEGIPVTDSLRKKFEEYGATVESVPDEKTVIVRGLTEDAQKKLRDLGYTVEEFPDGSFRVVANTDEAKSRSGRRNRSPQHVGETRRRSRTSVQTRQSSTPMLRRRRELLKTSTRVQGCSGDRSISWTS